jgi:pimeloyl-ACP methyl ester carboxylesterase
MHSTEPKIQFFTNSLGLSIAYAVQGKGPALVVPAWWVSHLELDWQNPTFQTFFNSLAEHYTVVRYDRPGVGLSDRQRDSFTLDEEVANLAELIEHLAIKQCTLLGVSCGGPPAMLYSLIQPEKVSNLVFFGSFIDGHSLGNAEIQEALCALVEAHWGLGAKSILDMFDPNMASEERKKASKVQINSASAVMAAKLLKLTFAMDASDAAGQLTIPALVLHRVKDGTVRFDAGRKLAALLPNSELVSLDGTTHLPWAGEDVRDICQRIKHFTGVLTTESEPKTTKTEHYQFRSVGKIWTLSFAGKSVHLKESRGLLDIAQLIANQNTEIHAADLAGGNQSVLGQCETEVLDQKAIAEYKQRVLDIEEEKSAAAECADEALYLQLETEQDTLLLVLKQGLGLGQNKRQFSSDSEKARKAVSARIRSTLKQIAEVHQELAEHLQTNIKTGVFCSYNTDAPIDWLI